MRPRTCVAATLTTAGFCSGVAMLIGWRHIAPRRAVLVSPRPPVGSTEPGFILTFDYLEYRGGPPWWPQAVVLPLIGLGFGLAVSVLLMAVAAVVRIPDRAAHIALWLAIPATGLIVGAGTAQLVRSDPPVMEIAAVTDPDYVLDPTEIESRTDPLVRGAPKRFDAVEPPLALPLLAGVAALAGGTAVQLILRRQAQPH